jgi:DNA-binding GntR family transcriptional regulator
MDKGVDDTASYLTPGNGDTWAQAVQATGGRGTQKLRTASRIGPPDWVASSLNVPSTAAVVARCRTMYLDEQPVELTDSYYPLTVAGETALERPGRIPGGAVTVLAERGYLAHHADESVDLDAYPTADEAALLGIAGDTRVVRIRRVVRTAADLPFEAMEIVMIPAGRTLRHRVIVEP